MDPPDTGGTPIEQAPHRFPGRRQTPVPAPLEAPARRRPNARALSGDP